MPRLIPPELGNGRRPSDPLYERSGPDGPLVPVLDVADDTHDLVGHVHVAALDPEDDTGLLLGAIVLLDNQRPIDGSAPGPLTVHVGASTLHEAATEVLVCVSRLALDMPEWVASSDEDLATVLAENYTVKGYSVCKVISLDDAAKEG